MGIKEDRQIAKRLKAHQERMERYMAEGMSKEEASKKALLEIMELSQ